MPVSGAPAEDEGVSCMNLPPLPAFIKVKAAS